MDVRQLTIFREVAKELSFTRAANNLNYVQPNVTNQIHSLEEELGKPLFDRLGRQVVLTAAGHNLLGYANRVLLLIHEAQTAVASGETPQGTLIIGSSETLCIYRLPALFRAYRDLFPQVRLIYKPSSNPELRRLVRDGEIDVAFTLEEADHPGGPCDQPLATERVTVLAPPNHPLALRQQPVGPSDLAEYDLLLTEHSCTYRTLFERTMARAGAVPATLMELNSLEAVKQCVMAGLGLTVLPTVVAEVEIAQGRLVCLPWASDDLTLASHVIWHKDKWLSPALGEFLGMAREILQKNERKRNNSGPLL